MEGEGASAPEGAAVRPRILITRAPHQASVLADALRALGCDPILLPTIELAPPTTYAPLDTALAVLVSYDWLLFTSANAVEALHSRLSTPYSPLPASCRIASIGPATTRALAAIGLTPTLMPPHAVAESLAEALRPHALTPKGKPTRFLLIRAEQARDHLPETLRAAGAHVTIAPAYRTIIPPASIEAVRSLFATPDSYPDAITFTSSSTATNLFALLDEAGLRLPPDILRISIGPITSQTLQKLGCPPHAEAAEPTVESLANSVLHRIKKRAS